MRLKTLTAELRWTDLLFKQGLDCNCKAYNTIIHFNHEEAVFNSASILYVNIDVFHEKINFKERFPAAITVLHHRIATLNCQFFLLSLACRGASG